MNATRDGPGRPVATWGVEPNHLDDSIPRTGRSDRPRSASLWLTLSQCAWDGCWGSPRTAFGWMNATRDGPRRPVTTCGVGSNHLDDSMSRTGRSDRPRSAQLRLTLSHWAWNACRGFPRMACGWMNATRDGPGRPVATWGVGSNHLDDSISRTGRSDRPRSAPLGLALSQCPWNTCRGCPRTAFGRMDATRDGPGRPVATWGVGSNHLDDSIPRTGRSDRPRSAPLGLALSLCALDA